MNEHDRQECHTLQGKYYPVCRDGFGGGDGVGVEGGGVVLHPLPSAVLTISRDLPGNQDSLKAACRYNPAYLSFDAIKIDTENTWKQAGAELGQAQPELGIGSIRVGLIFNYSDLARAKIWANCSIKFFMMIDNSCC